MPGKEWLAYEQHVRDVLAQRFPNATVQHNVKLLGHRSAVARQVDVLIEERIGETVYTTAVDAKHHKRTIDVKQVEAFIGQLNDIRVTRGIMVSPRGYTEAAFARAFRDDVDLDLDVLSLAELEVGQSFGAIVHAGPFGAIVPAPLGWVVEGDSSNLALARSYRRGRTFDAALNTPEWMYFNLWGRDSEILNLDALLEKQERDLKATDPAVVISVRALVGRGGTRIAVRRADLAQYPSAEITGLIEFDDFIFFAVLFTPLAVERRNVRKLEHLLATVIPLGVVRGPGT